MIGVDMNSNSALKRKLKKISDNIVNAAIENIKEEVGFEIEKHYELYIEGFYKHYENPVFYRRTYSTYEASDSYDDYTSTWVRSKNRVGIYVSADYIPGNPYSADKEWVFKNTFELGQHGAPPHTGWYPMDVPPYQSMKTWFKDFKANKNHEYDKIKEEALAKALAKYS